MWLFLLVSPSSELVLFPPFVLAILDLYYKHLSSHFRRLFFLHFTCGLRLISSLDSWWILKLSWIHTLDSFIEKILNSDPVTTRDLGETILRRGGSSKNQGAKW